jgi:SAM-dependent methyltransferase
VDANTIKQLVVLNILFYQSFAQQFSDTRQRLQPGVMRILEGLAQELNLLDLGCGNGELACRLLRAGFEGRYVGIDSSKELLDIAAQTIEGCGSSGSSLYVEFIHSDLTTARWSEMLHGMSFSTIFAFAVLHHLPGDKVRSGVLQEVRSLLSRGGRFFHSEWQFLNSPRLRQRIIPWESIGLNQDDVDPGDYLLDWRRGGSGVRYVHHFDELELAELAEENRFKIVDTFSSDGVGGKLALYQVWEAV